MEKHSSDEEYSSGEEDEKEYPSGEEDEEESPSGDEDECVCSGVCPSCYDEYLLEDAKHREESIEKWNRLTKGIISPCDEEITKKSLAGLKQYMDEPYARFILYLFDKEAMRRAIIKENPKYLDSFAYVYGNFLEIVGIPETGNTYLSVNKHVWGYHLNAMYQKYCEMLNLQ